MSQQQSQQQQQQQRGVIGQMPPSIPPGMGSPSGSPGLSNKNPASSRPAGMPASSTSMANQSNNSLPVSSMVFPGFPNINRSMSSNNGLNQVSRSSSFSIQYAKEAYPLLPHPY